MKYEIKNDTCMTRCPFGEKVGPPGLEITRNVGSLTCAKCEYFISGSVETQEVHCKKEQVNDK